MYVVEVGALQETKWFWNEVYEVNGYVVLTAGRETPAQSKVVQREERVVLVLRGLAIDTWRCGGRQWKAWSTRCVSVCLQMNGGVVGRFHVVSCYALTTAASREVKEAFFQELDIIPSMPS